MPEVTVEMLIDGMLVAVQGCSDILECPKNKDGVELTCKKCDELKRLRYLASMGCCFPDKDQTITIEVLKGETTAEAIERTYRAGFKRVVSLESMLEGKK